MKSLSCLMVLALVASFPAVSLDWQGIVRKYGPAVGKVEIRDSAGLVSSGSCFLIDRDGSLLTNAHVVSDTLGESGSRIVVTFPYASASTPEEYEARIEKIADEGDLDLAFLKIDSTFGVACDLATGGEPPIMSPVLVVGYPLGKSFKSTPGFIQAYQDIEGRGRMLDLSASVDPGNSGGPVFGEDGKVVGIVTARIYGMNFNLAMPIGDAIEFRGAERETVSISTKPEGARVFINGLYRGTSPLRLEMIRRDATYLVEKEGYVSAEGTVRLKEGGKPELFIELAAAVDPDSVTLHLSSKPAGARAYVDNIELGATPLDLTTRKGSKLRIKLILRGYRDFYVETVVGEPDEQSLEYTLRKAGLF